jgi:hypothetical protein
MPMYRVREKSYINNTVVEEGAIVGYDGTPSSNLEPLDPTAIEAAEVAGGADAESLERMQAAAKGVDMPVEEDSLA